MNNDQWSDSLYALKYAGPFRLSAFLHSARVHAHMSMDMDMDMDMDILDMDMDMDMALQTWP
jgi:hypothetical protein